ncbi:MAG: hypothetical protein BWY99_00393 [Synergistetes bacterium ADurb.BinA166]|nr:MAG: hypothetical protein BWY99_00393 [Synergistetes bacterium ADurb.BinA166]
MAHNWKNVEAGGRPTNAWRCKRCGSEVVCFSRPSEEYVLSYLGKRCEEITVARIHDE